MELVGKIERFFYQKPTWVSFLLEQKDGRTIACAGTVSCPTMEGLSVKLIGDYERYKGRLTFSFSELINLDPYLINFMSMKLKGVGKSTAKRIYDQFGEKSLSIIQENPDKLLEVSGIGESKKDMIVASFSDEDAKDFALIYRILSFFEGGISENQINKIIEYCNHKNIKFDEIEKNPYLLIGRVEGFGFKKVDKLAQNSGFDRFHPSRIEAGIIYALEESSNMDGHCFLDIETLNFKTCEIVLPFPNIKGITFKNLKQKIDEEDEKAVEKLIKKYDEHDVLSNWVSDYKEFLGILADSIVKNVENERIVIDEDRIYWTNLYIAETNVARIIGKLKKEKPIKKISSEEIQDSIDYHNEISKNELTLEQQSAVHNSLKNRISIITGGPGRGKTTVLSTIVEVWNDPDSIICLAPTGKAARRMSEAMSENGITMKTQTIHRFIMQLESSNSHCYDSLVIVDETSMVGIKLADRLLKRISDCQIILVGDVDQLASIEAGNVMKDIIKSKKVKTSYLTECFRNDGSILENANLINNGKTFKHFILDDATKFTHAESENIESEVLKSYRELRKKYDEKDIGILTPLRQRGFGSVNNINKIFRKEINPETIFNRECSLGFIVKDRVMNTKNRYDLKMRDNQTGKIINGIFNGDVGVVKYIDYDADEIDIEFEYEDKKFATGHWKFSDIAGIFVPAWSITIHKSQGSEYKAVIMVISSSQCFFLKRNLIYTGLTRAKNFVNIIGDEKAINIGIRNIDDKIRNTYLAERIKKEAK